jgi:hypothetical protein
MPPELSSHLGIGIGPLAAGKVAALTEEALTAGDGERHDHAIALAQFGVFRADLDHLAHRLMAEHIAALHRGNHTIIKMEVGTADCASGHPDDGVARMLNCRVGHSLAANVALAVPSECLHARRSKARRMNKRARFGFQMEAERNANVTARIALSD